MLSNKKLQAGTFEVEVTTANKKSNRFAPLSGKVNKKFGDICPNFEFNLPFSSLNYVGDITGAEARVYMDGDFYCGGYITSRIEKSNVIQYNCNGYGYEIAKTKCLSGISYGGEKIKDFLQNVIGGGIIYKKELIADTSSVAENTVLKYINRVSEIAGKTTPLLSQMTSFSGWTEKNITMNYILYDPFDYGSDTVELDDSQKPEANVGTPLLDFIRSVLLPNNLFLSCIGTYDAINDKELKKYLKSQLPRLTGSGKKQIYILALVKPSVNLTTNSSSVQKGQFDISLASVKNGFGDASNVLNPDARFLVDKSNRFTEYIGVCKKGGKSTDSDPDTIASVRDLAILDGTIDVVEFKVNASAKYLQTLINYEKNRRVAESYTYSVDVIGFKQGLSIKNINSGINKTGKLFWDVNQNINVADKKYGIDTSMFMKEVTLYWGEAGASTTLNLTLPSAYTSASQSINEQKLEDARQKRIPTTKEELDQWNKTKIFLTQRTKAPLQKYLK